MLSLLFSERNRTNLASAKREFATAKDSVLSDLRRKRLGAAVQWDRQLDRPQQAGLHSGEKSVQFAQFDCDRRLRRQFSTDPGAEQPMHYDEHRLKFERQQCEQFEPYNRREQREQ